MARSSEKSLLEKWAFKVSEKEVLSKSLVQVIIAYFAKYKGSVRLRIIYGRESVYIYVDEFLSYIACCNQIQTYPCKLSESNYGFQ